MGDIAGLLLDAGTAWLNPLSIPGIIIRRQSGSGFNTSNLGIGTYGRRIDDFDAKARAAGWQPGTREYNAAREAYLNNSSWLPWETGERVKEAVVKAQQSESNFRVNERLKRDVSAEGYGAQVKAQVEAARQTMPLQKEMARFESDLGFRNLSTQLNSQERLAAMQNQTHLKAAQIGGQYQLDAARIGGEYGIRAADTSGRWNLASQDLASGRQLEGTKLSLASNERITAAEMAQRRSEAEINRQLRREEFGVARRGQDYSFLSAGRQASTNLMSSAIQRRYFG